MGKSRLMLITVVCMFSGIQIFQQHVYAQRNGRIPKERICHLQRCHRYFKY